MKKLLFYLALATTLISCHEKDGEGSDPENDGLNLRFAIDWSALAEKPTGLTMLFYPADGSKALNYHFDAVDMVSVSLEEQDYSFICFNQSVEEFQNFQFDLEDYETASVTALSADNLKAGTLAITSMKSVQGTRGHNRKGALTPTGLIKPFSISIPAPGLQGAAHVNGGTLTNLSAGYNIRDRKPLEKTIEQALPADVWTISTLDDADATPVLTARFGSFGVSLANGTRAALDEVEQRNMLTVSVLLADGTTKELTADVTDAVVEQYLAALEEETNGECHVSSATTYVNQMGCVDLGLFDDGGAPLLWAVSNLGGYLPQDEGFYYAWGEVVAYGQETFIVKPIEEGGGKPSSEIIEGESNSAKTIYDWANYAYCAGTETSMTKYCSDADYGTVDKLTELESADDAASLFFGSPWRIPTSADFEKLVNECVWEWTSMDGVSGCKVYGPNGNSIFLPAVGAYRNEKLTGNRQAGYYWSSSLFTKMPNQSYGLAISTETDPLVISLPRYIGSPIRPVCCGETVAPVPEDTPNTH